MGGVPKRHLAKATVQASLFKKSPFATASGPQTAMQ